MSHPARMGKKSKCDLKAVPALRAFTLIELLIVVAIISILAAIAVPNFLESQTRAKVARVKADFRSLAAALEEYHVEYNHYPWYHDPAFPSKYNEISYRAWQLTTPIGYITTVSFRDLFIEKGTHGNYPDGWPRHQYNYRNHEFWGAPYFPAGPKVWVLNSLGPDRVKNQGLKTEVWARGLDPSPPNKLTVIYDPSNGTVSAGDIPRTGGDTRYHNQ